MNIRVKKEGERRNVRASSELPKINPINENKVMKCETFIHNKIENFKENTLTDT